MTAKRILAAILIALGLAAGGAAAATASGGHVAASAPKTHYYGQQPPVYYWPTLADLLGTLPLDEQAELITLADAYGVPMEPGEDDLT